MAGSGARRKNAGRVRAVSGRMERRTPVRHNGGSANAEHIAELEFGAPVHGEGAYFVANFEPPQQDFLDIDTTNVSVESCVQKILQANPAGDSLTR